MGHLAALGFKCIPSCFQGFLNIFWLQDVRQFFSLVILVLFVSFPLAFLQTSLSKTHIGTWENCVCRIFAIVLIQTQHEWRSDCSVWYILAKNPQRLIPSLTKGDQYPVSAQAYTHAHTVSLQPHPPLPCTYFPSPVVNCIPLDDITGNKRQQQDNKRSELQSTSFISDFITPPLMDVDLYTLLHITCSIFQPAPPPFSHFFSHSRHFTFSGVSVLFMILWLTQRFE